MDPPSGDPRYPAVLVLAAVVWALGTPATLYMVVHSALLSGPTTFWLLGALVCGLLVPAVAAVIALVTDRRASAAAAGLATALAVAALANPFGVAVLQSVEDDLLPEPTVRAPGEPGGCQEYSGGDSDCPGG